jgi:hypothetical protein
MESERLAPSEHRAELLAASEHRAELLAPSERRAWLLAGCLLALGVSVLVAVLGGLVGQSTPASAPPPIVTVAATPAPASGQAVQGPAAAAGGSSASSVAAARAQGGGPIVAAGATPRQSRELAAYVARTDTQVHIPERWMEGFYPIYGQAQSVFGVNWLLLASIHRQESAFSTAPSTYHGLNFAGCCGGPMQFNVTNGGAGVGGVGIPSTWQLVQSAYRYGRRPAAYDHPTATHPSIYDDFDAIMAAAWLLSSDGAGMGLDDSAWWAAYDYYGHDEAGVTYADQVLARAIGWSQHGFCINCGLEAGLVEAVHAAYGTPVQATYEADATATAAAAPGR